MNGASVCSICIRQADAPIFKVAKQQLCGLSAIAEADQNSCRGIG